ncbi:MAG: hypothetical protein ACK6BG_11215 [Cyanobacteriota bacterium]
MGRPFLPLLAVATAAVVAWPAASSGLKASLLAEGDTLLARGGGGGVRGGG